MKDMARQMSGANHPSLSNQTSEEVGAWRGEAAWSGEGHGPTKDSSDQQRLGDESAVSGSSGVG